MRPVIDMRGIHRIFETEAGFAHVLHDIDFTVDPGEFVAITGPSGSGKSTLMNILGCLDTPTSGTYLLTGLDVAELTDDELAEVRATQIGFVFQSFNLLPRMTVLENVMLPLAYTDCPRAERERRAVRALYSVALAVDHYDHRVNELSGGQMQRVAIARALVNDPAIILADEPTGNLDSHTGAMVLETLHALRRAGKTIVLITHDPGVAAQADRTVTIRDGRLYHEDERHGTKTRRRDGISTAEITQVLGRRPIADTPDPGACGPEADPSARRPLCAVPSPIGHPHRKTAAVLGGGVLS